MPRSLRRAVVGWYGLLAAIGFAVFGAVLHGRVREAVFSQVDAAIEGHAKALSASLGWDFFAGWELDLSKEYLTSVEQQGWYEITAKNGQRIAAGGVVPEAEAPAAPGLFDRGEQHEFMLITPQGARVRVGRSVAPELSELSELMWLSIGAGCAVLAGSLAGGWWFATRTLRPIEAMSTTAERISARELSRRIDCAALPVELRDLGATLNAAFERLETAFERQTRFTADVSHELRTPLSVIRAQIELALRKERAPEDYRHALETCLRSTERMTRIVEQMLAFASVEADLEAGPREAVSLDTLLRDCVEEVGAAARAGGVTLSLKAEPVRVRGDATQLGEVLSNLVTNAIRYNRPGGRVEISLERVEASAVLRVADNGLGIPNEALPFVFDRFFQVDPARSRASGGAGLGLALAQRIVLAHGGEITVASRLGSGSTFSVSLPALADSTPRP